MRRKLRAVAAMGVVVAVLGGCSKEPAGSGSTGTASTRQQATAFAACMRTNGVEQFPDPDGSGALTIDGVLNGSSIDPDTAAWKQAITACQDLEPTGFTGTERSAEQQSAALEFAQCIRDHGVEDFPDPTKGEPLVNTNLIPSSAREGGMRILNAAMKTCGDLGKKAIEEQR